MGEIKGIEESWKTLSENVFDARKCRRVRKREYKKHSLKFEYFRRFAKKVEIRVSNLRFYEITEYFRRFKKKSYIVLSENVENVVSRLPFVL